MKKIKGADLRTGAAFVRSEFYNLSIYRVSFWMNFVYTFLMMYSVGYVWRALYAANATATGVDLAQMISYAVLGVALEAVMHPARGPQNYMMEQVRKGTIEMDILKPIDFQFYMFAKNAGHMAVRFVFLVLPSFIAAYFFFSLQLPKMMEFFGFVCSLVLALIVSFHLNFMLGLLAMITMNIKNINWGYNAVLRFFSGQMVPLWIFPGILGTISCLLPFRCIYAIPMSIYIGNHSGTGILGALGIQAVWVVLLGIASRLLMRYVFGRVMIQGG